MFPDTWPNHIARETSRRPLPVLTRVVLGPAENAVKMLENETSKTPYHALLTDRPCKKRV